MADALDVARHGVLLAMLVVCVYTDLAKGKIYNAVTLPAIFFGLAVNYALGGAMPEKRLFLESLMAMGIGGGALFVVYLFGGFGAGDVKLMAAVGALSASRTLVVWSLIYTAIVGAALAVGLLVWKGRLLEGLRRSFRLLVRFRRHARGEEAKEDIFLPYGFAISVGTLWAWLALVAGML